MSWQKETPSECKCSWWSSSLLSTAPPYYRHLNLPPVDKLKSLDFQKFYKLLPEICFFFFSSPTARFFHSLGRTLLIVYVVGREMIGNTLWSQQTPVLRLETLPPLWVGNIILLSLSQLTFRERYESWIAHTRAPTDKDLSLSCMTSFPLIW